MLAYVFWHAPGPGIGPEDYEDALRGFQHALAQARPPGLIQAAVFRCDLLPWLAERPGYADWYLLDGSAALDVLNSAAVSGACRGPHDEAARRADAGVAGLYRLRLGAPDLASARGATWFSKRSGESYDALFARARSAWIEDRVALFGRQMTLGPTPEFCLLSPAPIDLEADRAPRRVRYQPLG
jgi:hypothetical protein